MGRCLIDFIVEVIKRFGSKSPKFFVILQYISFAVTLVTGLPELIEWLNSFGLNLHLPEALVVLQSKVTAIAGIIAWIISKLTVDETQLNKTLPITDKKADEFST
jgi:hypothetical protein